VPRRKAKLALAVSGLLLNVLGAVVLLSLSPAVVGTCANPNATLFIVWHRSMGASVAVAVLLCGFLLQLVAALRE
jgi:hypothetical protein